MKIRSCHLTCLIGLSLFCGNSAKADFMGWSYSTTPSVFGVSAGGVGGSSGGVVQLTDFTKQAGATSIPVIAAVTSSASTSPVTFDPKSSTYTLTMTITDNTTHDSGTLTFTGAVGGTLSATTSTLTNAFAPSSNSLTLDGHTYTVTLPSTALESPTSPQQNIMATVSVTGATAPPPPTQPQDVGNPPPPPPPSTPPTNNNTPEPSSIILACAAIGAFGVRRLRQTMA